MKLQEWAKSEVEMGNRSRIIREAAVTGDFDYVLRDAINKIILKEYDALPFWFEGMQENRNAKDFKDLYASRMGNLSDLLELSEGESYSDSSLNDEEENYKLAKWGRKFSITYESLVNDDLGVINKAVRNWGRSAKRTVNKRINTLVDGVNGTTLMADGCSVITSACTISNCTTNSGITATAVGEAYAILMAQQDQDGEVIQIIPRYLVVPVGKAIAAAELVNSTVKIGASNATPNAIKDFELKVLVDPFMSSITHGLIVADKASADFLEVAWLYGKQEPDIMMMDGFENDTILYKARLTFQGKILDRRGVVLLGS